MCKLESVFIVTSSVTFQPQSHFRCSGVQSFLLWPKQFLWLTLRPAEPGVLSPWAHCGSHFTQFKCSKRTHRNFCDISTICGDRGCYSVCANNRFSATAIIISAPTRAIDMAPNTYQRYHYCPTHRTHTDHNGVAQRCSHSWTCGSLARIQDALMPPQDG